MSSIEDICDSTGKSTDKKYKEETAKLGWIYKDVLYTSKGLYALGIGCVYGNSSENKYNIVKKNASFFFSQNSTNENVYSLSFIAGHQKLFPVLNEYFRKSKYCEYCNSIGNIIPIWPGGNFNRGAFDLPEPFFNDESRGVKEITDFFYKKSTIKNSFFPISISGETCYDKYTIEDFMNMDGAAYFKYLKHVVAVIKYRNEEIEKKLKTL